MATEKRDTRRAPGRAELWTAIKDVKTSTKHGQDGEPLILLHLTLEGLSPGPDVMRVIHELEEGSKVYVTLATSPAAS